MGEDRLGVHFHFSIRDFHRLEQSRRLLIDRMAWRTEKLEWRAAVKTRSFHAGTGNLGALRIPVNFFARRTAG